MENGEFRQVCEKIGVVGRYLSVLELKTSCQTLSVSVRWTETIWARARLNQY